MTATAGEEGGVLEASVAVVDPQQVVGHVVGDVDVEVAVVVEVLGNHAERGPGLVDARGMADFREAAGALVAEQAIPGRLVDLGRTVTRLAFVATAWLVVGQAEIDVVGDVEVAQAVAVEVREACTDRPRVARKCIERRDVPEPAVAQVLEQLVRPEVGEKDIEVAVVVDVPRGDPHAVAGCTNAGGLGRVDEAEFAVLGHVPEQAVAWQGRG